MALRVCGAYCFILGVMMTMNFVPEMHDLGKLVDNDMVEALLSVKLDDHFLRAADKTDLDFAKIGVTAPATPTWIAVQHHQDGPYQSVSTSPLPSEIRVLVALTALTDVLAASSSRATPEEEKGQFKYPASVKQVHWLWNPQATPQMPVWSPVRGMEDLREMFAFVNQESDAEAFFTKYREYLEKIPEDKSPQSDDDRAVHAAVAS
jgi:hypothetical protein